jgi:hypothetical protein
MGLAAPEELSYYKIPRASGRGQDPHRVATPVKKKKICILCNSDQNLLNINGLLTT